jgi:hypothetical protein
MTVLPYMDPARLQEPLLFFEIPVAAIYSTSLDGRQFGSYRPSHDVSRAPGALHGGGLFLIKGPWQNTALPGAGQTGCHQSK